MNGYSNEPMLDIFIYETTQNIEQLEKAILDSEKTESFSPDTVNEIFRIMHTIKGSSAMMLFNNMASLTHVMEDLFYCLREEKPDAIDFRLLADLVLECVDFIKVELEKIKNQDSLDGDAEELMGCIRIYLASIKGKKCLPESKIRPEAPKTQKYYLSQSKSPNLSGQKAYEAVIFFDEGCEMENIRAFAIIHNLKEITEDFSYYPEDIIENNDTVEVIREQGFKITFRCEKDRQETYDFLTTTAFVRKVELTELEEGAFTERPAASLETTLQESSVKIPKLQQVWEPGGGGAPETRNAHQTIISVDVVKLDKLMDLMGEMVIAEAMVTQNPDLQGLKLNDFHKAARQLRKITSELQDMVMSIRMVPLSATFRKMHRIVRDMGRKLDKDVELRLIGEETEVDKNIIEHISDPLMHLVRNAVDHGLESNREREAQGKPKTGVVTLEAKNAGSDVLVIIRDDGKGLNKDKILQKALQQGLLNKPQQEMTDKEIFNLIFLPGFSTNDQVSEYSGRGVGMDVVVKNLEAVGGSVSIESTEGEGTAAILKIPLTLAIIDGMNIKVGRNKYTLPTTSIQETFQAKEKDLIKDPGGAEMIMVRGECYPILRLHEKFAISAGKTELTEGIMLMIEEDGRSRCLFADELLGQHQVVVKTLPAYLKNTRQVDGLAGCTLLGDGSISLILNIGGLLAM